jgi:PAS domain S-box-containing protein
MAGGTPVFEWTHKHSSGRPIPCEVRLVRLPGEGRPLLRGSVIDNTERKRREAIQQATYQISEAVHAVDDLQSLYKRIHDIVQGLMPAENFYISLLDPADNVISFPYYVDQLADGSPDPRPIGTGLTGYVLRTGKPLLLDAAMEARKRKTGDAVTFDGMGEISYIESGRQAAIWLGVPLTADGRTFGAMAVQDYHNERAYGDEEKQILTFVAAQTAVAIVRKRTEQALRERTERAMRHRSVLLTLAQMDKSDLPSALEQICLLSSATFAAARVSYWSVAPDGGAITCELLYDRQAGRVVSEAKGTRLTEEQCPAYFAALSSHEPIIANDAQAHPSTCELTPNYLVPLGITSMLDAPVWLEGKVVGVLCHEHVGPRREWLQEEIDFSASLATMVSLSIEAAQRSRSEAALRQRHREVVTLLDSLPGYAFFKDAQFRYVMANQNFCQAVRMNNENILGKNDFELFPRELAEKYRADDEALLASGRTLVVGEEIMLEPGRSFYVQTTKVPVHNEQGQVVGLLGLGFDVTDRKKAEEELLRTLAREKELGELKSNFVSMVSHEFRTPLGIVMSSAEILRDYLEQLASDERQHHLLSITRNVRRMANLMEEVLVLGRLDAAKMAYNPTPLDLPVLCRRITDEVLSATEGSCPIELILDSAPPQVNADEPLLRHILTNLLTNAVKYSDAGTPVDFVIERQGCEAVFVVKDRGIGIPDDDKQWLFSAFHRGRNVGQRAGTGLGLVIVKRCVELHRGRIDIESKPCQGTRVTVRLPICPPSSN